LVACVGISFAVATAIGVSPMPALARSNRLRPPPDVDLDPDRGMTFGRMSKITHDQRAFRSFNQATRPGGVDPGADPYTPVSKNQYDPDTGIVHGSLNDAARQMRQAEDASRRSETVLARERAPQKTTISLKPKAAWPPPQKKSPAEIRAHALTRPN
jgi:hypothetical protein